jgi:exopolysaccharide production protein ExoQ
MASSLHSSLTENAPGSLRSEEVSKEARRLPIWECALAATAFATLAGAGDSVLRAVPELDYYGPLGAYNEQYQLGGRVLLVVAALIAARNVRATGAVFLRAWPLSLCVLWIGLSSLWSIDPMRTLGGTLSLTVGLVLVAGLVGRYGTTGITLPMRYAGIAVVIVSFILLLVAPAFAFNHFDYAGAFRGVFLHKNVLGLFLASVIICALAELSGAKSRLFKLLNIVLIATCFQLLAICESATALVISAAAIVATAVLWLHRRSKFSGPLKLSIIAATMFVITMAGLIWGADLLNLLGREITFTGRTFLWRIAWDSILDRPLLGFGYGTYWSAKFGVGWVPWHAHNGYLDAQLSGGIVLLGLIALQTALLIYRSVSQALAPKTAASWFIVLVAALLPVYNMVESIFIKEFSLPTLLFATATFLASRKLPKHSDARRVPVDREFRWQVINLWHVQRIRDFR